MYPIVHCAANVLQSRVGPHLRRFCGCTLPLAVDMSRCGCSATHQGCLCLLSRTAACPFLEIIMCVVVTQVLEVPALRRGALITLAVHAGFVQRLWFSHMRVQ